MEPVLNSQFVQTQVSKFSKLRFNMHSKFAKNSGSCASLGIVMLRPANEINAYVKVCFYILGGVSHLLDSSGVLCRISTVAQPSSTRSSLYLIVVNKFARYFMVLPERE